MMVSMLCNYVEISFGVCWVMLFSNTSIYSHRFWVGFAILLFVFCVAFCFKVIWAFQRKKTCEIGERKMGGKRKRVELASYSEWMEKVKVWDILRHGNFIGYMERLKGNNLAITH